MNKNISHINNGERFCSKIGGGFALAAITPSSTQNFLVNDETQVATDLWTMVKRGVECSGFPVENIDIKKELPSAENLNDDAEINQYFYHSDHLGSSSFITDATGNATQHLQYLSFGETWIDQQSSSFDSRYKFSAKELDDETQYSYFGARYYDSDLSVWLSVDPLSDKYPNLSPYAYCFNNPIRFTDPYGLDGEDEVAPAGYTKHTGANGGNLYLPTGTSTTTYSKSTATQEKTGNTVNVTNGGVRSFTIGEGDAAKTYDAMFSTSSGSFTGYKTSSGDVYNNPAGLQSNGTVSQAAWGETQGLIPTTGGNIIPNIYNPSNWSYKGSIELMKARAAIQTISTRNSSFVKDTPNMQSLEKNLSAWCMTENFPKTDAVILQDPSVKYFYLSHNPNAKHTGLNYKTNNVTMVKSYGPFYNVGGDVTPGPTYILFYKATPK